MGLKFFIVFNFLILKSHGVEIVAHKGVHHEECFVGVSECLSHCLNWADHHYIENTIPALAKAFELGADRAEIDLQFSADGEVVVYHDQSLKCRAGLDQSVNSKTVSQLKKIDITANLKYRNRIGNPLVGLGIGMMPTLREVLLRFPKRGFILNPKSVDPAFLSRLNEVLAEFIEQRKTHDVQSFSMWGPYESWRSLKERFPGLGDRFAHSYLGRICEQQYRNLAWSGYFPNECKNIIWAFSALTAQDWSIWGGILGMIQAFHLNHSKVYIVHLSNRDEMRRFVSLGVDGIISGRMEILP